LGVWRKISRVLAVSGIPAIGDADMKTKTNVSQPKRDDFRIVGTELAGMMNVEL